MLPEKSEVRGCSMRQFTVSECPQANQEHQSSERQYAHVFHKDGQICVAQAFWGLPERLRLAILLHEAGHILAGPRGGELAANRAVERESGIPIEYRDCRNGARLEWISPRYTEEAKEFLGLSERRSNVRNTVKVDRRKGP